MKLVKSQPASVLGASYQRRTVRNKPEHGWDVLHCAQQPVASEIRGHTSSNIQSIYTLGQNKLSSIARTSSRVLPYHPPEPRLTEKSTHSLIRCSPSLPPCLEAHEETVGSQYNYRRSTLIASCVNFECDSPFLTAVKYVGLLGFQKNCFVNSVRPGKGGIPVHLYITVVGVPQLLVVHYENDNILYDR